MDCIEPSRGDDIVNERIARGAQRAFQGPSTSKGPTGPTIDGFGSRGQNTSDALARSVLRYNANHGVELSLDWDQDAKQFTIAASAALSAADVGSIIESGNYRDWYPILVGQDDASGDYRVGLSGFRPPPPGIGQRIVLGEEVFDLPPVGEMPDGAAIVAQGQVIISTDETDTHLMTSGLGPCIGVFIYTPEARAGALAHLASPEKVSGRAMATYGVGDGPLQAIVVGGDGSAESNETFSAVQRFLAASGIDVVETNVGHKSVPSSGGLGGDDGFRVSAPAFDLRDGSYVSVSGPVVVPDEVIELSYRSVFARDLSVTWNDSPHQDG